MVLWKKESTSDNACYIDLLPSNQVDSFKFEAMKSLFGSTKKNEKDSIAHRKKGNESFKAENWFDAMEYYNKSVRFAPNGSECLGLGYANRAACFLHMQKYDKCLADIELAKNANYPQHLMRKLDERKAACLKAMKESAKIEEIVIPVLSYSPNKELPGMADVLKVSSNNEYGKHVVATQDIDVGKIIIVEDVFAIGVDYNYETICKTCARHITNFIPCPNCTNAIFCDAECMESNDLHNKFCGALYDHWPRNILLVETILIAACAFSNADALMKFVERALATRDFDAPECESNAQIKYRLFLKLFVLSKDVSAAREEISDVYNSLLEIPFIVEFFRSDQEKRFLMHLIGQHHCILDTNRYGVSDGSSDYMSVIGICSSLFNHSCVPNVLHLIRGNKMIGYVVRPVKKGEQLFINNFEGRDDTSIRQQNLKFQCKCSKCVPRWKQDDGDRIQMDPDYYFFASVENKDFKNPKKRSVIKAKLENLLTKFGRLPWSSEFEMIDFCYGKCCTEEISFVEYRSSIERQSSMKRAFGFNEQ